MSQSDKSLAFATGAASGTFKIADRKFHLKPVLIVEYNQFLEDGTDRSAWVIDRLNDRIADRGEPIDIAFLENNLALLELEQVKQVLLYGKLLNPN